MPPLRPYLRRGFCRLLPVAVFGLLVVAAAPAGAQWVWKDSAGHTIASDQPPPMDIPRSRIVKEPRSRSTAAPPPAAETPKDGAAAPRPDAPKSVADQELDSKQRAKDAAEAQKKADDEATRTRAMAENCRQVKSNVVALQTGGRAARFNEKGEKVYIDDNQRQAEIDRQQGQVGQYCNK